MFAVIYIPNFSLQAALRHEPEMTVRPVGLIDGDQNKTAILQLTEAARQAGVCEGLTSTQALARCPQITIKLRSLAREQAATAVLLQCAYNFSPRIEATADGVCTLDLKGLTLSFGETVSMRSAEQSGTRASEWAERLIAALAQLNLQAQVGIAETPDLALQAARHTKPFLFVEDGHKFIAALPIESLEPTPDIAHILRRWGIRTVGAFTALGKDKIAERLGGEALELFDRASCSGIRALNLVTPPEDFSEAMDFEMEIESLEPLLFVLRRFVGQLSNRVGLLGLVIAELKLRLTLSSAKHYERLFKVPAPTGNIDTLFRMLTTHLENVRTDAPIVSLQLTAIPSRSTTHQFGLFEVTLRDPNQFHHTLARLSALCGADNVGSPVVEDSFRPDAFRLETPKFESPSPTCNTASTTRKAIGLRLRRFRPAFHADVEVKNGGPAFISSLKLNGPVESASGPWRSSGNWWERDKLWNWDAWDVQTRDGALYRIYRENRNWFLEGVYD